MNNLEKELNDPWGRLSPEGEGESIQAPKLAQPSATGFPGYESSCESEEESVKDPANLSGKYSFAFQLRRSLADYLAELSILDGQKQQPKMLPDDEMEFRKRQQIIELQFKALCTQRDILEYRDRNPTYRENVVLIMRDCFAMMKADRNLKPFQFGELHRCRLVQCGKYSKTHALYQTLMRAVDSQIEPESKIAAGILTKFYRLRGDRLQFEETELHQTLMRAVDSQIEPESKIAAGILTKFYCLRGDRLQFEESELQQTLRGVTTVLLLHNLNPYRHINELKQGNQKLTDEQEKLIAWKKNLPEVRGEVEKLQNTDFFKKRMDFYWSNFLESEKNAIFFLTYEWLTLRIKTTEFLDADFHLLNQITDESLAQELEQQFLFSAFHFVTF